MDDGQYEALDTLAQVLEEDVVSVSAVKGQSGSDLIVTFRDGRTLYVEVKAAAHPTPDQVRRLVRSTTRHHGHLPVLVADVLNPGAREELVRAGWGFFDRRGHLYLNAAGTLVEMSVPARPRVQAGARPGIRGASGVAVAYAHLLDPSVQLGVRQLARVAGIASPTSVGNAQRSLREANLLEPDGRPVLPELFWALAAHWSGPLLGVAASVTPDDLDALGQNVGGPFAGGPAELATGGPDAADYAGVAVSGDLAAALLGAPVVRAADSPFDLYVDGPAAVSRLRRRFGEADPTGRSVGVRPVPARIVARFRAEPMPGSVGFPVAHPLTVALDLAQDPGRGREILDSWRPEGYERVW